MPVHGTGEINTRYIREAISKLRRNEPSIAKLTWKQLFHEIDLAFHPAYTMEPSTRKKICGLATVVIDRNFNGKEAAGQLEFS